MIRWLTLAMVFSVGASSLHAQESGPTEDKRVPDYLQALLSHWKQRDEAMARELKSLLALLPMR